MRRLMVAFVALALLLLPVGPLAAEKEPASSPFTPAGSLAKARSMHTATLLSDGRVLVVGGRGRAHAVATVEVWDPTTRQFSPAGSLAEGREGHTATLLSDGRVLVVGGSGAVEDAPPLATAEVWDPATGQFISAGSLAKGRESHTATLLSDGRVLVVGGDGGNRNTLASAEVWDPATGAFAPTGSLDEARSSHTATLVPDGRVLVIGGTDWWDLAKVFASMEVWDPETSQFAPAGSLAEGRMYHTATLLPDGGVLVVGGWIDASSEASSPPPAEVWDPATCHARLTGSLDEYRANHTATLLPDGRVLVVGGGVMTMGAAMAGEAYLLASAEVWDPATGQFAPAGSLAKARLGHTATLLPDGRVLVIGGSGEDGVLARAEVWKPNEQSPPTGEPNASPVSGATTVPEATHHAQPSEGVVVLSPGSEACPTAEPETPATGTFTLAGALAEARLSHTATPLPDGRVLVVGGSVVFDEDSLASAEVWDSATALFAPAGSLAEARRWHTATLLPDGHVLVIGGSVVFEDILDSAEVWDPATAAFGPAGSLALARTMHTATLLPDGRVLLIGGYQRLSTLSSAEVWDPTTGTFGPAGALAEARDSHTATLLPDGRVLVVGGSDKDLQGLASAEVWDPATASFGPAGSLAVAREYHEATLLPDGRVLVVGGYDSDFNVLASAEAWDPATASFGPAGSLAEARGGHTATLLPDGRVLVIGGSGDDILASAEVWDPATASFARAGSLAEARSSHTATLLPDGRVLVVGGEGEDDILASAEVWEPIDALP